MERQSKLLWNTHNAYMSTIVKPIPYLHTADQIIKNTNLSEMNISVSYKKKSISPKEDDHTESCRHHSWQCAEGYQLQSMLHHDTFLYFELP